MAEHACNLIEKVESSSRSNHLSGVLSQNYSRFCLVCHLREIFNSLFHAGLLFFVFVFFFFFLSWVFVPTCRLFVVVASGGYSLVEVSRLLIAVASVVAEHRL